MNAAPDTSALPALQQQLEQLTAAISSCMGMQQQGLDAYRDAVIGFATGTTNNMPMSADPACAQSMPGWIVQHAVLEARIARLSGNPNAQPCDFVDCTVVNAGYLPPSSTASDEVVERYSRQAIRGNVNYTDSFGDEQELPYERHYYRDQASGHLHPSELPDAPINGRTYERLIPEH
jgi:hypothetical protein